MGSIAGQISYSGLSTGQDFKAIVDQMVAQEERVIVRQEIWKSQWQEKLTAINDLDSRLVSLKGNAQQYDTYDELLAREAASSDEDVVTISNTSTAPPGVYEVEVGDKIKEILTSKPTAIDELMGINKNGYLKNEDGQAVDKNGNIIGTKDNNDPGILDEIAKVLKLDYKLAYDDTTKTYYKDGDSSKTPVAEITGTDPTREITKAGDLTTVIVTRTVKPTTGNWMIPEKKDTAGVVTEPEAIISTGNPKKMQEAPLTITMGGKTLTLEYDDTYDTIYDPGDPTAKPPVKPIFPTYDPDNPKFHEGMTIEQMNQALNDALKIAQTAWKAHEETPVTPPAIIPLEPPNIKIALEDDSGRDGKDYKRLMITGLDGGKDNHITVSDPTTNLHLNKNSVAPVFKSSWASQIEPSVVEGSEYTGHVNKTITVVVNSKNGVMGTDNIEFSWADTEGNKGTFMVKPSDWDPVNNKLKEPIELLQGVEIDLKGSGGNNVTKGSAFTIDCHAPVMQKASDSGLAQTDQWVHEGVGDLTTPVSKGSGVLAITYGGKEHEFKFSGDLSISAMAEKINSDPKNPGVIATVLNDGRGTANSYKLVLNGTKSGAENGIKILDSTKISDLDTGPEAWENAREASNSMCRIDGVPTDGNSWVQRPTNEVGDVINGVVLNLQGIGSSMVSVKNNITEMTARVTQLVESVNFCKQYIKEQTAYSKDSKLVSKWNEETQMFERHTEGGKGAGGVMIGNYGFQISLSTLDDLMINPIFTRDEFIHSLDPEGDGAPSKLPDTTPEGEDFVSKQSLYDDYLEDNGLLYTKLSDIGIVSDGGDQKMGLYTIEQSKLTEALTKNPEAVLKLFTFDPGEGHPPDMGILTEHKPKADEDSRPRIAGFNVMMGYAMSDLTRTTDVIDPETGDVLEAGKGITRVLSENYTNIMNGIDAKIAREEIRIGMMRVRLTDRFTRLEVQLAELQTQATETTRLITEAFGD